MGHSNSSVLLRGVVLGGSKFLGVIAPPRNFKDMRIDDGGGSGINVIFCAPPPLPSYLIFVSSDCRVRYNMHLNYVGQLNKKTKKDITRQLN